MYDTSTRYIESYRLTFSEKANPKSRTIYRMTVQKAKSDKHPSSQFEFYFSLKNTISTSRASNLHKQLKMPVLGILLCWQLMLLFWSTSDAFVIAPYQLMPKRCPPSLVSLSDTEGNQFMEAWKQGGKVDVEVCKTMSYPSDTFPTGVDPLVQASNHVREAWMKYHWEKGGGLPIVILEPKTNKDLDNSTEMEGKKRVIAPVFMEETISSFPSPKFEDCDACLELEYKVTSPGPFFGPDLVKGSHNGRVSFSSAYVDSGDIVTTLVWKVQFDAIRLLGLYQAVTEFTIGTAASTVQEAVSPPRLLTITTRLPMDTNEQDTAHIARSEWLDFLYSSTGGGLPILPPIPFGEILSEGGGIARKKRYLFPFVVETAMVDGPATVDTNGTAIAYYQIENPGWWTFPFLFHTHLGRVKFQEIESTVNMTWEVEIRPYRFCAPLVEKLTEAVVTTIARNFRTKVDPSTGFERNDEVVFSWSDGKIE